MRWLRHLFSPSVQRFFSAEQLQHIGEEIARGEQRHGGQVVFAVEAGLSLMKIVRGVQASDQAQDVFSSLRVWDTEANNGVLIYLLLADRRVEIVADRGLRGRVTADQWQRLCHSIEAGMRADEPEQTILAAVRSVSEWLTEHYPRAPDTEVGNELHDSPRLLR